MDFRFVHLADLHFSVYPSHVNPLDRRDKSRLHKAAWILERKRRSGPWSLPTTFEPDVAVVLARDLKDKVQSKSIDGIIVTGDLATTGHERDLNVAKQFLTGKLGPEFVLSDLGGGFMNFFAALPVIVLPGNHDRYTENFAGWSQQFEAKRNFSPAWCGGYKHVNRVTADSNSKRLRYSVFEKGGEKLILVQADFSLKRWFDADLTMGVAGILGQGYAYNDVIKSLKALTARLRDKFSCRTVIWLCHFPPDPNDDSACPANMEMRYGSRLSKAASASDVKYILAGHIHRHICYSPISGLEVICSASATDPVDTPSFNEITFSVSGGRLIGAEWQVRSYSGGSFV